MLLILAKKVWMIKDSLNKVVLVGSLELVLPTDKTMENNKF